MGMPTIGTVLIYAGDQLPKYQKQYWMFCHGQQLLIDDYKELYFLIGTTYGGDGESHFNLPDFRGRVALGAFTEGPLKPGAKGGEEKVTLTIPQMAQHQHTPSPTSAKQYMQFSADEAVRETPITGDVPAWANFGSKNFVKTVIDSDQNLVNGQSISLGKGLEILETGGGEAHENRQPYTAINYMIAVKGILPQRQ